MQGKLKYTDIAESITGLKSKPLIFQDTFFISFHGDYWHNKRSSSTYRSSYFCPALQNHRNSMEQSCNAKMRLYSKHKRKSLYPKTAKAVFINFPYTDKYYDILKYIGKKNLNNKEVANECLLKPLLKEVKPYSRIIIDAHGRIKSDYLTHKVLTSSSKMEEFCISAAEIADILNDHLPDHAKINLQIKLLACSATKFAQKLMDLLNSKKVFCNTSVVAYTQNVSIDYSYADTATDEDEDENSFDSTISNNFTLHDATTTDRHDNGKYIHGTKAKKMPDNKRVFHNYDGEVKEIESREFKKQYFRENILQILRITKEQIPGLTRPQAEVILLKNLLFQKLAEYMIMYDGNDNMGIRRLCNDILKLNITQIVDHPQNTEWHVQYLILCINPFVKKPNFYLKFSVGTYILTVFNLFYTLQPHVHSKKLQEIKAASMPLAEVILLKHRLARIDKNFNKTFNIKIESINKWPKETASTFQSLLSKIRSFIQESSNNQTRKSIITDIASALSQFYIALPHDPLSEKINGIKPVNNNASSYKTLVAKNAVTPLAVNNNAPRYNGLELSFQVQVLERLLQQKQNDYQKDYPNYPYTDTLKKGTLIRVYIDTVVSKINQLAQLPLSSSRYATPHAIVPYMVEALCLFYTAPFSDNDKLNEKINNLNNTPKQIFEVILLQTLLLRALNEYKRNYDNSPSIRHGKTGYDRADTLCQGLLALDIKKAATSPKGLQPCIESLRFKIRAFANQTGDYQRFRGGFSKYKIFKHKIFQHKINTGKDSAMTYIIKALYDFYEKWPTPISQILKQLTHKLDKVRSLAQPEDKHRQQVLKYLQS